jgi:integration host factor subunit alpha
MGEGKSNGRRKIGGRAGNWQSTEQYRLIDTTFDRGGTIMSLTKIDIIDSIYEKLGIPKKECVRIVESVFEIIKDDLDKGHDVMISGFGKWTVKAKRERKGRNPQTGEALMIGARRVVTFKPSSVLRGMVSG